MLCQLERFLTESKTLTVHVFQLLALAGVTDRLLQRAVVDGLLEDLWEEVRHNAVEEFEVILQELGHVDVSDGTQTDQLLQNQTGVTMQLGLIYDFILFVRLTRIEI